VTKTKNMTQEQRLQVFIYLLLRDCVNFGAAEKALQDLDKADQAIGVKFSEPSQAAYALTMARNILKTK
jgi:hypothetical protein